MRLLTDAFMLVHYLTHTCMHVHIGLCILRLIHSVYEVPALTESFHPLPEFSTLAFAVEKQAFGWTHATSDSHRLRLV